MKNGDLYQHYNGGIYEYIGEAIHTDTNEELVVYKNMGGQMFVRPLFTFFRKVDSDGNIIERFKKIQG
jgi:hypothetical protein